MTDKFFLWRKIKLNLNWRKYSLENIFKIQFDNILWCLQFNHKIYQKKFFLSNSYYQKYFQNLIGQKSKSLNLFFTSKIIFIIFSSLIKKNAPNSHRKRRLFTRLDIEEVGEIGVHLVEIPIDYLGKLIWIYNEPSLVSGNVHPAHPKLNNNMTQWTALTQTQSSKTGNVWLHCLCLVPDNHTRGPSL